MPLQKKTETVNKAYKKTLKNYRVVRVIKHLIVGVTSIRFKNND